MPDDSRDAVFGGEEENSAEEERHAQDINDVVQSGRQSGRRRNSGRAPLHYHRSRVVLMSVSINGYNRWIRSLISLFSGSTGYIIIRSTVMGGVQRRKGNMSKNKAMHRKTKTKHYLRDHDLIYNDLKAPQKF